MCIFCHFWLKPVINAFGVKYVPADWYFPNWNRFLKFLKTYHAFILFKFVYSLIIILLLNQCDKLIYSLFIVLILLFLLFSLSDLLLDAGIKPTATGHFQLINRILTRWLFNAIECTTMLNIWLCVCVQIPTKIS